MSNFAASQALMAVVAVLYLASFQFSDRRNVLACIVGGAFCIAGHFFLLGKFTAGLLACVSGSRVFTAYFTRSPIWMWFFLIAATVAFLVTFESPLSILLYVSSLGSTWAVFRAEDRLMRIIYMFGTSMWLIHNILIWTPGGVVIEGIFLTSNIVGFYRFYLARRTPQNADPVSP